MRVPMLLQWKGVIEPSTKYDGLVANIDLAPTLMDVCGIAAPADYRMDGISFKPVLYGDDRPIRDVLFGELGHSRAVKTKEWKYIAVRYPEDIQRKIDRGGMFNGFKGEKLKAPYLTRNGHLGHHAAAQNPHYFEQDQLYDLRSDPEELVNVHSDRPAVAEQMKEKLKRALREFEDRPFGEFNRIDPERLKKLRGTLR